MWAVSVIESDLLNKTIKIIKKFYDKKIILLLYSYRLTGYP